MLCITITRVSANRTETSFFTMKYVGILNFLSNYFIKYHRNLKTFQYRQMYMFRNPFFESCSFLVFLSLFTCLTQLICCKSQVIALMNGLLFTIKLSLVFLHFGVIPLQNRREYKILIIIIWPSPVSRTTKIAVTTFPGTFHTFLFQGQYNI